MRDLLLTFRPLYINFILIFISRLFLSTRLDRTPPDHSKCTLEILNRIKKFYIKNHLLFLLLIAFLLFSYLQNNVIIIILCIKKIAPFISFFFLLIIFLCFSFSICDNLLSAPNIFETYATKTNRL